MIVTGISYAQFADIVERVSNDKYSGNIKVNDYQEFSGNRFRVTIRAKVSGAATLPAGYSAPGARRSWNDRRLTAACWHAHRDVLSAVFALNPDTKVYTAMARYIGRDGFEREYPATAYRNIGSWMQPCTMLDCCDCA